MAQLIAQDPNIPIQVIATDQNGAAFSLQTATSVTLVWDSPDSLTRKSAAMAVQNSALIVNGVQQAAAFQWAQYLTQTADFPVEGTYAAQAQVVFSGSNPSPSSIPFSIVVGKRL